MSLFHTLLTALGAYVLVGFLLWTGMLLLSKDLRHEWTLTAKQIGAARILMRAVGVWVRWGPILIIYLVLFAYGVCRIGYRPTVDALHRTTKDRDITHAD